MHRAPRNYGPLKEGTVEGKKVSSRYLPEKVVSRSDKVLSHFLGLTFIPIHTDHKDMHRRADTLALKVETIFFGKEVDAKTRFASEVGRAVDGKTKIAGHFGFKEEDMGIKVTSQLAHQAAQNLTGKPVAPATTKPTQRNSRKFDLH